MASSERLTHLFLDTEFTDLHRPYLISVGLVDATGEHRFYAELCDTWQKSRCSYFVLENVIPLQINQFG